MATLRAPTQARPLDALLRQDKPRLLERWARAVLADPAIPVASRFDVAQLQAGMPELVDHLAEAVCRPGQPAPSGVAGLRAIAGRMARSRVAQQYTLSAVMREVSHLRSALIDAWYNEGVRPPCAQIQLVHTVFDDLMCAEADEMERASRAAAELDRQRIRAILQLLPVGVVVVDAKGAVVEVNAAAEAIWERPLGAIRQMSEYAGLKGFRPGTGAALRFDEWGLTRALTKGEASHDEELEILAFNGERKTILCSTVPIRDASGAIAGAVKTMVDVTRRLRDARAHEIIARATEILGESFEYESTLKAVARLAVPHLATYVVVDLLESDGQIRRLDAVTADPRLAAVLARASKYPPVASSDRPAARALRSGRPSLVGEVTDRWVRSVAIDADHLSILRALGPVSAMIVPVAARGKVFGVMQFFWAEEGRRYDEHDLSIAEDLAGRAAVAIDNARLYRDAERAIHERDTSLAELSAFLATAGVGCALLDRGLRFLRVNEALAAMDLVPEGEHLGRTVGELWPWARDLVEPALRRAFATGERLVDAEFSVCAPAPASPRHFLLSCAPIRVGQGEVQAAGIVVTEVTQQRHSMEDLNRAADLRERFIGMLTHDLRNPLGAITGTTATLLRRTDLPESVVRDLARVSRSATRIERMISDMLDLTRSRVGGGLPIAPEPVDLNTLCRQAIEELEVVHPDRTVTFHAQGDGRGLFNPERLLQVVSNVVGNACEHSPPGTPVRVATRAEEEGLVLEVSNQGPPIAPAERAGLFDPFWRGDKQHVPHGRSAGLGLGLFIAQQIVQAHGGSIGVSSDAERGTTFTVRLPRERPEPRTGAP